MAARVDTRSESIERHSGRCRATTSGRATPRTRAGQPWPARWRVPRAMAVREHGPRHQHRRGGEGLEHGGVVFGVDDTLEVRVDEAGRLEFLLPCAFPSPVLHPGERARSADHDDRQPPDRGRDVHPDEPRPAPGCEAAHDDEGDEAEVHDHHQIGEEPVGHTSSVVRRGATSTRERFGSGCGGVEAGPGAAAQPGPSPRIRGIWGDDLRLRHVHDDRPRRRLAGQRARRPRPGGLAAPGPVSRAEKDAVLLHLADARQRRRPSSPPTPRTSSAAAPTA